MTARVTLDWHGQAASRRLQSVLQGRLARGANILQADTRRLIQTPYPPASRPGQPPHRRTGRLWRSVRAGVKRDRRGLALVLSASAPYAGFLEFGTVRMAARPFLFTALRTFARSRLLNIMKG